MLPQVVRPPPVQQQQHQPGRFLLHSLVVCCCYSTSCKGFLFLPIQIKKENENLRKIEKTRRRRLSFPLSLLSLPVSLSPRGFRAASLLSFSSSLFLFFSLSLFFSLFLSSGKKNEHQFSSCCCLRATTREVKCAGAALQGTKGERRKRRQTAWTTYAPLLLLLLLLLLSRSWSPDEIENEDPPSEIKIRPLLYLHREREREEILN